MPIPSAGPDGKCIESSYGHFMEPVRKNSCVRSEVDIGRSCESAFDARRFTELSVCRRFQTGFDGCDGDWVTVELGTVTYRNDAGLVSKVKDITVPPKSTYLDWATGNQNNETVNSYSHVNSSYIGEYYYTVPQQKYFI